jgi:hypothetical protein
MNPYTAELFSGLLTIIAAFFICAAGRKEK